MLKRLEPKRPLLATCLRLTALTGCRPGEIKALPWAACDLGRSVLRLRDTKTGHRAVWLAEPARKTLETVRALPSRDADSPWVFPSEVFTSRPIVDYQRSWRGILVEARIASAPAYIIRHTFASESEALGHSPYLTSALLGHALQRRDTTRRYVHHIGEDVRRAAERVSQSIARALDGEAEAGGADVVPLRSSSRP